MVIPNQAPNETVEHPQANLIMVLGLLSPFCLGVLGPIAWALGRSALTQIDRSNGGISGRAQVMIGYVAGIIGTGLMLVTALLWVLVLLNGG